MARYETTIHSPMSQEEAFSYMADLRNFDEWDPGVKSAKQVVGTAPELGAEYDLELSAMTLRYKTVDFTPPDFIMVEAHSALLSSYDIIEVTSTQTGCDVRYHATVKLNGPLKLLDPAFALIFDRIGDKAAEGMAKALHGSKEGNGNRQEGSTV